MLELTTSMATRRNLYTGWLSGMVNLDEVIDLSLVYLPGRKSGSSDNLQKESNQLEAGIQIDTEKGKNRDPGKQVAIMDAEEMRDKLQVGEERFFRFGIYFTIYAATWKSWNLSATKSSQCLANNWYYSKPATSQQEQGFNSTVPQMTDQLQIRRNLSTGALSTSFPFTTPISAMTTAFYTASICIIPAWLFLIVSRSKTVTR